jgi:ADP-heptose:LPS heptosyltransferase
MDLRGIGMESLCDIISAARLVIGVSSGVMHLAAACGADLVVWGDDRTYYNETLEKRYKETWNPHHVNVQWITGWQPGPHIIINAIEKGLSNEDNPAKYAAITG